MRTRSGLWLPAILTALMASAPLLAKGTLGSAGLPRLLSDDTVAYLTVDAGRFEYGMSSLSLAALLRDPEVQEFLAPIYSEMPGLDPADPVASLLAASPASDFLAGEFSVGISGVSFEIGDLQQETVTLRLSPSHPITARLLHDLTMLHQKGDWDSPANVRVSVDFLAAIEPGPALKQMAREFLDSPPPEVAVGGVQIAGAPVTAVNIRLPEGLMTTIYADLSGDSWLIGGDQASFSKALVGGPKKSLANSSTYKNFHGRVAGEGNTLFCYLDAVKLLGTFRNLVSPIMLEEAEILGIDSLQGVAFGVSMLEGGVRESILLGFDGNPHGIFSLFDAFGGGFPSLREAPPGTGGFLGLRFDPEILKDRMLALVERLAPGLYGEAMEHVSEAEVGGLNLLQDILPALGSELSLAVSQPKNGPIPEVILSMEVRDEARFAKLLDQAGAMAAAEGDATITALALKDGADGFYLTIPEAPVQPAFALRNNRLYGAISPLALKNFLYKHAGNPDRETLADTSEVLPTVMEGLTGGRDEVLTALIYVDLKATVPVLYGATAHFLPGAFAEAGIPLDAAMLPMPETIAGYLSGVALGISSGKEGLSIDIFTPTGIVPMAASAGILEYASREQRSKGGADYK